MNSLVKNLKASATLALNQKAKDLQAQGKKIINLTTGEPDFGAPKRIQDAAIVAIQSGKDFYTASSGILELREAIAKSSSDFYTNSYTAENVIVTNGGKQALFNTFFSVLEPGDEVLVLKPYWVSYPEMVSLCQGVPVFVDGQSENNFKPNLAAIEAAITKKTKAIVINSPTNPTSQILDKHWIIELMDLFARKAPQAYIVSDDIYAKLILDDSPFYSCAMNTNFDQSKIVLINGLSKTYSMTGWRVGWAITDKDLIKGMSKVQSQTTANINAISQWAAIEAVTGDQSDVEMMRQTFIDRKNECMKIIETIPLCSVQEPKGGFYFFFDVREAMRKANMLSDVEMSNMLLENNLLALVPGSAFGSNGFLRMSFATSIDTLREGLVSLKHAFQSL